MTVIPVERPPIPRPVEHLAPRLVTKTPPRILVDFDDVVHNYHGSGGWTGGAISGAPIPGAFEWLASLVGEFEVWIFSVRCRQIGSVVAMKRWFRQHWPAPYDEIPLDADGELAFKFTAEKIPAMLLIDDRCLRFTGVFPSIEDLKAFRTWSEPTLPLTDMEMRHRRDLNERVDQLYLASDSYHRLAATPCMRPEWSARLRYVAAQAAELAADIRKALPGD